MMSRDSVFSAENQRAIIWFYFKLGKTQAETFRDMHMVYGGVNPSKATISRWYSRFADGITEVADMTRPGRPSDDTNVGIVGSVLDEHPYSSARSISNMTGIPKTSVLDILKDKLGLRHVLLRWIPHSLSDAQREDRVSVARALLIELESTQFNKLAYLMTSDETWVTFANPHSSCWARSRDEAGERARQTITKAKTLVVVFWGFTGFFYATTVPIGMTYNSAYVRDCLVPQLTEDVSKTRKITGLKGTVLHWDNARAHTSRETKELLEDKKVKILPHLAYSPDLSPPDFFIFGTLKERMKGTTFSDSKEVLDKIYELWRAIPKETLRSIFDNWKMRLNLVIRNNGEYCHN